MSFTFLVAIFLKRLPMASNIGLMGIVTCQPQTDIGRRMLSPDSPVFPLNQLLINPGRFFRRRSPNRVGCGGVFEPLSGLVFQP
jgi:hypothetical protein